MEGPTHKEKIQLERAYTLWKKLAPSLKWILIIALGAVAIFIFYKPDNENQEVIKLDTLVNSSTSLEALRPTPEIVIPVDRKLKADEVINILSILKDFGSQTEEKYNFVKIKTKEIWANLGIEHPKPESGWSSWNLEKEDDYYPGSFNELSLEDIDIFNLPGKEKMLKINEGFENYRYLIFDKDGNYLDQLGYYWQKYAGVESKVILINLIPYLAVTHMIGGGSGTATYVTSIYQLDDNRQIKRVLGNIPWDSFGEPVHEDFKDGTKTVGREEFKSEIIGTGNKDGVLFIKLKYVETYVPYSKSDKYVDDLDFVVGSDEKDKYSTREEHTVLFTYDFANNKFITSDKVYKDLVNNWLGEDALY